ncbi:uncharacterized protein K452DRAFT_322692 [Aplosporella prunicola CBS 121167]|uniref:Uncharacterized protein n=1 Tax=Aplosporella prunicola CBS 121167 TaxID=1176127 RepID=A0A6A6AZ08_9PEZI|nr:uncharacterized protein K452DRAFT_322692 [Aplosporella prunicola CBS 121167]KAF2136017.1 hypothetical protein K452DRAFT_322692 [Aplosporella prunicola CBS 121167]
MLDENLPTFFLKASTDQVKHNEAFYFSQHGSEPAPAYTLRHPDPVAPNARNRYAAGLFDAHNPDVLFGEVLIQPEWTYPTLSPDEIRKNGGVVPPPQIIMPSEFTIQLYDPNQQVIVRQKSGSWGGTASYEFQMPVNTFRLPSASTLDRTLNDPAADITTPKINFVWRREGKMNKDLSCFMTGRSTDPAGKKKKKGAKEPAIAIALFRALREMTVYESNMYRVDIEDPKGLEIVLLLAAATIRDVFFGNPAETFNTGDPNARKSSGGILTLKRKNSSPLTAMEAAVAAPAPAPTKTAPAITNHAPHGTAIDAMARKATPSAADLKRQSLPPLNTHPAAPPPLDPRAQWDIDAETARLRAQAEQQRRDRARSDAAEQRRTRKLLDGEDKERERERRRRAAEVERETERLRRRYGSQDAAAAARPGMGMGYGYAGPQRHSAPLVMQQQGGPPRPHQRSMAPTPAMGHPHPHPQHAQRASSGMWIPHHAPQQARPPQARPQQRPTPTPLSQPQRRPVPSASVPSAPLVPPPQRLQSIPQARPVELPVRPALPASRSSGGAAAAGAGAGVVAGNGNASGSGSGNNAGNASRLSFFGGGGIITPDEGKTLQGGKPKKKSLWGLRSKSEGNAAERLRKKSTVF